MYWTKVVVWLLLIGLLFGANLIFNNAVQPDLASDVALRQLERSDQAAVETRVLNHAFAVRVGLSLLVGVVGTALIFGADIRRLITQR